MADWEHDKSRRESERDWRAERDWRGGPEARGPADREGRGRGVGSDPEHARDRDRGERDMRHARDERPASYERGPSPFEPGGAGAHGYGQGGDTSYGQMAGGSSDSGLGGYGSSDVGGYGQPTLNSQSGQGGFAPLNQGIDYGQDGARFGPKGYDTGDFGQGPPRKAGSPPSGERPRPQDHHEASYHSWRDTQLASHDRDYSRWRNEQVRRYDEDYGSWRNERHEAFSKEFEGWRSGRGGQAAPPTGSASSSATAGSTATVNPSERSVFDGANVGSAAGGGEGSAHGANPTLAKIAEGHETHHGSHDKDVGADKDRSGS